MGLESAIPIEAFFGPNGPGDPNPDMNYQGLAEADVIFGVDVMSGNAFPVYGRDILEEIVATGEARGCRILKIGIDQETDELEKLCALVQAYRGKHEYQDSGDDD